jgi:hypothetical protein
VLLRAFDKIKPGNALMYYPEANVLVPRAVDPASRTPTFKHVLVRLEPAASLPMGDVAVGESRPAVQEEPLVPARAARDNMRAC